MVNFVIAFHPQAQLADAQEKLLSIDPTWVIESGFLMAMAGGSAAHKLQQDFMELLPAAGASKSLKAACQAGNVLVNGKLASLAGAGCVGQVKSALACLQAMQCGQAPKIPAHAGSFLQGVFARLPFFAQYQGKGDKCRAKQLTGKAAVLANYHAVLQQDPSCLSLKDLEQLCVFSYLLTGQEQAHIAELTEQVFQSATGSPQSKASSSRSAKGKASQADMASSVALAAAMFK